MSEKVEGFEDLVVWKEGMRLATEAYPLLKDCRDFGLRDQVQRSAVSIPSKYCRRLRAPKQQRIRSVFVHCQRFLWGNPYPALPAYGVRNHPKEAGLKIVEKTKKLSAMLYSLIKVRKEKFV